MNDLKNKQYNNNNTNKKSNGNTDLQTNLQDYPIIDLEIQKCQDFLHHFSEYNRNKYMDQLQEISDRIRNVLEINMDDILTHFVNDDEAITNIYRNTNRFIRNLESAADNLMPGPSRIRTQDDIFDILQNQRLNQFTENMPEEQRRTLTLPKSLSRRYEISLIPASTEIPKKLREIKASDIGHFVVVKGMVTRSSDVKPYISVCTYICDICGSEIFHEIVGNQFMPILQCPSITCTENKTSGRILMQTRGSKFVKYQEIRIQELPDQVPVGHIPRAMTIQCRGEITRKCGPGDIITICGIFKTVKFSGFKAITAGLQADTFIEAYYIQKQKLTYDDLGSETELSADHIVREIASQPDPYSRLASSIAPEIFGHEDVKKALLLQLVGGVCKTLPDGMKIRGDINICLMGDPGVAKSQLLKNIASIAPRGVYTTGKGSSGVGLTAAIVKDNLTGELALEGGALVLADLGICCIDEFDKMDDSDRTAIHEVMEQQTVSIAKAGITTTLNARTAVLAAANPLYGRYNRKKSISENVDLPNSLLSRFDLMFLIIDKVDSELDIALSKHVLHVHKYLKNPERVEATIPPNDIKKYIASARCINPTIPQELSSYIVEAYVSLRSKDAIKNGKAKSNDQTVMTPRQLLSILRLSQALARLRMSETVSREDVDESIRLTHASKSSLIEDTQSNQIEDATSAIFNMIRDSVTRGNGQDMAFSNLEGMIVKKGFTAQQFENCLNEYENLGVIHINSDRTKIEIVL